MVPIWVSPSLQNDHLLMPAPLCDRSSPQASYTKMSNRPFKLNMTANLNFQLAPYSSCPMGKCNAGHLWSPDCHILSLTVARDDCTCKMYCAIWSSCHLRCHRLCLSQVCSFCLLWTESLSVVLFLPSQDAASSLLGRQSRPSKSQSAMDEHVFETAKMFISIQSSLYSSTKKEPTCQSLLQMNR